MIPIIGAPCDCASAWLEAQSPIAAIIAEREPRSGRKNILPIRLLIPWPWKNAFLRTASSPAAQCVMPSKADILKGRVGNCFRCAVKQCGLKKPNAKADFFFIGGRFGSYHCLIASHILRNRRQFLLRTNLLRQKTDACQDFLTLFGLGFYVLQGILSMRECFGCYSHKYVCTDFCDLKTPLLPNAMLIL